MARLNKEQRDVIIRKLRAEADLKNKKLIKEAMDNFVDTPEFLEAKMRLKRMVEDAEFIRNNFNDGSYGYLINFSDYTDGLNKWNQISCVQRKVLKLMNVKLISLPNDSTLHDELILNGCSDAMVMLEQLIKKYCD